MNTEKFGLLISMVLVAGTASAQPATQAQREGVASKPEFSTMHLVSQLGSFRLIDGQGRVEFTFTGTVLLSQVKGKAVVTGDVVKQYEERGKTVYFGTGRVVVTGSWRAIQWFGKNMNLVWYGTGVARLAGEYYRDKATGELMTGWLWYDNPKERIAWPAQNTIDHRLPKWDAPAQPQPRRRPKPAG